MSRYIDADELKKVFRDTEDAEYAQWTLAGVIGEIDNIEAADVQEVRHGRWILGGEEGWPKWTCSVCGGDGRGDYTICPWCGAKMDEVTDGEWNGRETPYCPNCGAKMEAKGNEND